jgi:RsiW-degrading membrane proteinase PrsW (M82 family)
MVRRSVAARRGVYGGEAAEHHVCHVHRPIGVVVFSFVGGLTSAVVMGVASGFLLVSVGVRAFRAPSLNPWIGS